MLHGYVTIPTVWIHTFTHVPHLRCYIFTFGLVVGRLHCLLPGFMTILTLFPRLLTIVGVGLVTFPIYALFPVVAVYAGCYCCPVPTITIPPRAALLPRPPTTPRRCPYVPSLPLLLPYVTLGDLYSRCYERSTPYLVDIPDLPHSPTPSLPHLNSHCPHGC